MTLLRLCLKLFTILGLLLTAFYARVPAAFAADPATILLVVDDANTPNFDRYLGEILRAEGLNSLKVLDISVVTGADLTQHDVVILAQIALDATQAGMFTTYVSGGGRLLAMRPDSDIASLFGLDTSAGTLTDGYLKIEAAALLNGLTPGHALTPSTLQIHGVADQYNTLAGAVTYAQLYRDASTVTSYPAVVGDATGKAVAFTYDLATNIVYTRQGNPANADQVYGNPLVSQGGIPGTWDITDPSEPPPFRTTSLFQLSNDLTQPAWIDRDRIPIPQADEQQRLFARLVRYLVTPAKPLPQLWYFPGTAKTVLIVTSDSHANGTVAHEKVLTDVNANGGKVTFYISNGNPPTDIEAQTWLAQGHSIGLHPYPYKLDPYPPYNITTLDQGYFVYDSWFSNTFSFVPSRTVRHHRLAWKGWTDAVDLAVSYGMKLDANFYHWGKWLQKTDSTWPHGYITGSGQPMKFIRADGTILDYYQQLTQLVDEHLIIGAGFGWENLDGAQATLVSQQMIDSSLGGDYAALMAQFHVDYYFGDSEVWAEQTMQYAKLRGVPIWSADQWLTFTETRHDANYADIAWNAGASILTFNMTAAANPNVNLTTMLPLYEGRDVKTITVDGAATSFSTQLIKGVAYAFVTVPAGNHSFSVAYYPAGTPTSLFPNTASQPQSLRPLFDWTNATDANSYTLQVAMDRNFAILLVNTNVAASAHTLITDLPRGTTLYWRARGNKMSVPGNWSSASSFDTPNPPGLPIVLSPVGGLTTANRTPTLDWTDSFPAATRYEVQIAADNGFVNVLGRGQGGPTGVSQYTVEDPLGANQTFYWRVRAFVGDSPFGAFVFSEWSSIASFKTPP